MGTDSDDLEEILESLLDTVEIRDIHLSQNVTLPVSIRWIVSDGTYVTEDQILAILTPLSGEDSAGSELMLKSPISGKISLLLDNLSHVDDRNTVIGKVERGNCRHEILIHGLCAYCSLEVEDEDYDDTDGIGNTKRPREDDKILPGFITNNSAMKIDPVLADDLECNEVYKYLKNRKLCLVLDLDNTLLHASSQKPPMDIDIQELDVSDNDVKRYIDTVQYLEDDESLKLQKKLESSVLKTAVYNESETTSFKSYTKLRPGVFRFLRESSRLFDLYLYTMGTKQHASTALSILDPQGIFFNKRVFCRNDGKSFMKSLDRIFPKYKHVILIVDDTEFVWTTNINLIRIQPYFFFPELSYLNSKDFRTLTRSSAALQAPCIYSNFVWPKVRDNVFGEGSASSYPAGTPPDPSGVSGNHNRGEHNPDIISGGICGIKDKEGAVVFNVKDEDGFDLPINIPSPLKKNAHDMQKQFRYSNLLISNEKPSGLYAPCGEGEVLKKVLVSDTDAQLERVSDLLSKVHSEYFKTLDGMTSRLTIKNLKKLLESNTLPNAGNILQQYQKGLMANVCLYANPNDFTCPKTNQLVAFKYSDYAHYITKFGAKIAEKMNEYVTHYICNNYNNVPYKNVKVVHIKWIEAVMYTWQYISEDKFNVNNWKEPFRSFWDILHDTK